jgi:hypothetical protein
MWRKGILIHGWWEYKLVKPLGRFFKNQKTDLQLSQFWIHTQEK